MRNLGKRRALTLLGLACLLVSTTLAAAMWWDLFGTGIATKRAQAGLEQEFSASLAPSTAPDTTSLTSATPSPIPSSSAPSRPYLADGEPVARLEIPSLGLKQIVVMGTTDAVLKKGPGLFRTAEWPGEIGNTTIAGHRTSHGAPFRHVDKLAVGDRVTLTTQDGSFIYSVTETFIVQGNDTSPLKNTPGEQVLTLVSCHPLHSTAKRIIVRATLVP